MAHSVVVTTPIPTLEETAAIYGLSKVDLRFVASLFERQTREGAQKPASNSRPAYSGSARISSKRAAGETRHAKKRTRKAA